MKKLLDIKSNLRKIEIVEIEDSFLNFFTPSVVVAAGYFLFNLIYWPLQIIEIFIIKNHQKISSFLDSLILGLSSIPLIYIFEIITLLFFSAVTYYIFVIRLGVKHIEFKKANFSSLICTLSFFFAMVVFYNLFRIAYHMIDSLLGLGLIKEPSSAGFKDPLINILYLIAIILQSALFLELIFRRTLIPLFEDRGLSPLLSTILSGWGQFSINIPTYIVVSIQFPGAIPPLDILYSFFYIVTIGFFSGLIYINTRNWMYSVFFISLMEIYCFIGLDGPFYRNILFNNLITIINIIALIAFVLLTFYFILNLSKKESTEEWIKLIKRRSAPKVFKGILGFFGISLCLLMIQTLTVYIGRMIAQNVPLYTYPNGRTIFLDYFLYIMIFYIFAFSIPFWLTIRTEYAQDQAM